MHFNHLEQEVQYHDEHDLNIHFGPSSPHSECSIPNNFLHDHTCDIILDVSMVAFDSLAPFIPLMTCDSQISIIFEFAYFHPLCLALYLCVIVHLFLMDALMKY